MYKNNAVILVILGTILSLLVRNFPEGVIIVPNTPER